MIERQKIEYIQTYALIVCYKVIVKIKCLKQFCSFHIYYKYNIIIKVLNTMLKSVKIYDLIYLKFYTHQYLQNFTNCLSTSSYR